MMRLCLWWGMALLGLMMACQGGPSWEPSEVSSVKHSIIGGVSDLRYPAVGRLLQGGGGYCTGTLIAPKVILTAAHCVDAAKQAVQQNKKLEFFVEIPAASGGSAQTKKYEIDGASLFSHPQWNRNASLGYDVGVMILKAAIPSSEVQSIPFNTLPIDNLWQGQSPLFLGYGLVESYPNSKGTQTKQGITLGIFRVLRDRLLYYSAVQGICSGDSGGPALMKVQDQLRVIAVNSYVTATSVSNRSACNWLGAGMRTDTYETFLNDMLKLYGDGAPRCSQDADCGGCGRCQGGRCQAQAPAKQAAVCRPCDKDADCGSDGRCTLLRDGWRCIQHCSAHGCCPTDAACQPYGTGDSMQWVCMPTQLCVDVVCQKDADCGLHGVCAQGKCAYQSVSSRASKLCQPCQSALDCDGPGHLCLGAGEGRFCSQPCEKGGRCPQGFVCSEANPGSPRQCVPSSGVCQVYCLGGQPCPQGWTCNPQKVCVPNGGVPTTGACNNTLTCSLTLSCTNTVDGARCLKPCRGPTAAGLPGNACLAQDLCSGKASCFRTGSGSNVCMNSCVVSADCRSTGGGFCPPANKADGSTSGVCVCRLDEECAPSYRCFRAGGRWGTCIPLVWFSACLTGQTCSALQDSNACIPDNVVGQKQVGDICDGLNRCRSGLICLPSFEPSNTSARGVCVERCPANKVCQGGGTCTSIFSDVSVCLCQPGQCPSGRFCQRFESYAVCTQSRALLAESICRMDAECPSLHRCDQTTQRCVATKSWPEPTPERKPEPQAEEVRVEPAPEKAAEPTAIEEYNAEPLVEAPQEKKTEQPQVEADAAMQEAISFEPSTEGFVEPEKSPLEKVQDGGNPEQIEQKEEKSLEGPTISKPGCGCSVGGGRAEPSIGLLWVMLLLLLGRVRKRSSL